MPDNYQDLNKHSLFLLVILVIPQRNRKTFLKSVLSWRPFIGRDISKHGPILNFFHPDQNNSRLTCATEQLHVRLQPIDCTYIKTNKMRRDVFQAIADPKRRDIIGLIAKCPMTPNAIAESFNISRQAISKHIQILTDCGVLTLTIQGREYYYSVQPKKLSEVADWLEPFRTMWEGRFNRLDKVIHTLKPNKNGK
jgi:DNA-binding transcriptional ArsR family regulator